jgi:hypothetical protein
MKKRLIRLFYLLMGLVLVCCGPSHFQYIRLSNYAPIPERVIFVYIDKNFEEEDRLSIYDSLMRWNYVLNGHIIFNIV